MHGLYNFIIIKFYMAVFPCLCMSILAEFQIFFFFYLLASRQRIHSKVNDKDYIATRYKYMYNVANPKYHIFLTIFWDGQIEGDVTACI